MKKDTVVDAPPEQEYIITEEELSRLEGQAGAKYDCDPSEV